MAAGVPHELDESFYTVEKPSVPVDLMAIALSRRITLGRIAAVLAAGFTAVMLLLFAAGGIAVRNSREIQADAEALVREQALASRLMNQMRVEQSTLNAVFYQLIRDPEDINRAELIRQLETTGDSLSRLTRNASATPEAQLWSRLDQVAQRFAGEAKEVIVSDTITDNSLRDLFKLHDQVMSVVRELAEASAARARKAEIRISEHAGELMAESVTLLGGCLILSILCAALTVRLTYGLFRRMESQANELSRVSWHMLRGQEEAARRFSHELHDELGQSLAAVKANLAAMSAENLGSRRTDCLHLVDEAIVNVRDLSQLLRPVILDDFGLDAGLRWLAEGFSQRTGIQVAYHSSFSGRLTDETETHLFRIAQEALTNIARHSGATEVNIELSTRDGHAWLTIADNGRGMPPKPTTARKPSIGLVGMRARARQAGGDFIVESPEKGGLKIEVWVPIERSVDHATEETAHSIGR